MIEYDYFQEEVKSNEDLQSLKSQIEQIISVYNTISKDEQICINITGKNQDNNKVNSPEKIDVSKYFICSYGTKIIWVGNFFLGDSQYDFDSVGLFEKVHDVYDKKEHMDGYYFMGCWEQAKDYDVRLNHQVYLGINSDQVAIYELSSNILEAKEPGYTTTLSDGRQVSATCVIGEAYSFDSIRLKLYQAGNIAPYEIGKATNAEILEVLSYAQKMFDEKNEKQRKRQK